MDGLKEGDVINYFHDHIYIINWSIKYFQQGEQLKKKNKKKKKKIRNKRR